MSFGVDNTNNPIFKYTQTSRSEDLKRARNNEASVFAPKLGVIDDFTNKCIDIDGDKKPDVTHGDFVIATIKAKAPDAKIVKFEAFDKEKNCLSNEKIGAAFEEILKRNNNGEHFDGVNMSISPKDKIEISDKKYEILEDSLNADKNEQESSLHQKVFEKIKPFLRSGFNKGDNANSSTAQYEKVISTMEGITAKDTPIYVSAGNDQGNIFVSQYATGKGVTSVGDTLYSDLCDKYADGTNMVSVLKDKNGEPLSDKKGNLFFDVNGDGKSDYKSSDMADPSYVNKDDVSERGFGEMIEGSSFSSPTSLVEDLKTEWEQRKTLKELKEVETQGCKAWQGI